MQGGFSLGLINFFSLSFHHFINPLRNSGHFTWASLQQPQEQRYPFLTVRAVFLCIQTKVWLPLRGMFNVRTDVKACNWTWGLCGHCKWVCTESWLWEKNGLPHWGIKPASVACSSMLYQLGYTPTPNETLTAREKLILSLTSFPLYTLIANPWLKEADPLKIHPNQQGFSVFFGFYWGGKVGERGRERMLGTHKMIYAGHKPLVVCAVRLSLRLLA